MVNFRNNYQLPNGTYVQTTENNDTFYECQFCSTWFKPKKRFVQKFCSESCRVLSCRESNSNLKGNNEKSTVLNRKKVTNKNLSDQITEAKELIDELNRIVKKQDNKISSIKNNQDIHMWISGLMPLVAEPLRKGFVNLLNNIRGNKNLNSFEQFQVQTNHVTKDLPEELKVIVNSAALSYYQNQNSGTKTTSNKIESQNK